MREKHRGQAKICATAPLGSTCRPFAKSPVTSGILSNFRIELRLWTHARCERTNSCLRGTNSLRRRAASLAFSKSEAFEQSCRERKRIEMLFAHLKRILRLGRLRLRGPRGAQFEFTLAAIAPEPAPPGKTDGATAAKVVIRASETDLAVLDLRQERNACAWGMVIAS